MTRLSLFIYDEKCALVSHVFWAASSAWVTGFLMDADDCGRIIPICVRLCLTTMRRTSSLRAICLCRDSSGAEQKPEELRVGGSIPSPGTILRTHEVQEL